MQGNGTEKIFAPWRLDWVTRERENTSECVFCALEAADSDRANRVLTRGEQVFSVLNKAPYNPGHVLVVPRAHGGEFAELDTATLTEHHHLVQKTIEALRESMAPEGFNVGTNIGAAGGASIDDHLHTHIVPRWGRDTTFMPLTANTTIIPEALDATYDRLHKAMADVDGVSRDQPERSTTLDIA